DNNGNGEYDEGEDDLGNIVETDVIIKGKDPDVGFLAGMIQSFGDAPGGFSEELQEFTYALSAEYMYQDAFALRAGFFHESPEKGARQFMSLGAGFKFKV
ncbi:PorV/PorQ family protein, partial [Klebsiella pneumoniae]|uniref:PorV/PorQ family protein n=1 Tax=Klebsiella pneumoniae TaxID=573 RepID=UPI0021F79C0E